MNEHRRAVEFNTTIDEHGAIYLPEVLQNALHKGTKVSVRVVNNIISKELKSKNVSEEEIEQIMNLQMEDREHVLKFLLSESSFAGNNSFIRRAKQLFTK